MSTDAQPIDPARFAQALETLPVDALHAKAAELLNSAAHLRSSNRQMLPFADAGDADCREAMFENLGVIARINERVRLVRREVERRGMRWSEGEVEDAEAAAGAGVPAKTNGVDMVDGDGELVNGTVGAAAQRTEGEGRAGRASSGRLTDEELRRLLEERMQDEEEGVHL